MATRITILFICCMITGGCASPPAELQSSSPRQHVQPVVQQERLGESLEFDQAYWDSTIEMACSSWERFLDERIKPGMSVQEVDAVMKGNYRDRTLTWYGDEGEFTLYYLVDDFFQVHVDMQRIDGVRKAILRKRGLWLRFPAPGGVALIPTYLKDEVHIPDQD